MQNTIDYKLSDMILYHKNEQAKEYILNNNVDINAQDQMGFSYLHCAVTRKNDEIIDFLLDHGININIQDEWGKTPLILALIQYGSDDTIIRHLIARGADMTITTFKGRTALDIARTGNVPEDIIKVLEEATLECPDLVSKTTTMVKQEPLKKKIDVEDNILDYFALREKYSGKQSKKKDMGQTALDKECAEQMVVADEECNRGVEYCQKQDFISARKCFEISAEAGSSVALGNLGLIYLKGYGVDVDEKKSFEYFYSSAEKGNTMAMMQVSDMYRLGVGIRKNLAKSNYWKMLAESPAKYNERKEEIQVKLENFLKESETLDAESAEEICLEIVDMIPEPQTMYEEMGIAYYTLGTIFEKNYEYSMAVEAYNQAINVVCVKNNPVIPYRIGCCNFKMNNEAQAKTFFKKARKLGGKGVFGIDNDRYWELSK